MYATSNFYGNYTTVGGSVHFVAQLSPYLFITSSNAPGMTWSLIW